MIINVCPAGVTAAPVEQVWRLLATPERFGEWLDASFVSADPPGPARVGQKIRLSAPALGRRWPVLIDVVDLDPAASWIDLLVRLPFGVENHERVTLNQTPEGKTLVRFN